jgi:hypothetical protein
MTISATDLPSTESRKNDRRISILNNATRPTLTLPTPPNRLFEGRSV